MDVEDIPAFFNNERITMIDGRKPKWLERAINTQHFHVARLEEDYDWTLTNTAKALHRSVGSICEDLLIVSWLKTHEHKIKEFKYAYQALEYIRKHKKRMETQAYE